MFESRFKKGDERLNAFATAEFYGENFIYAGLFYNYDENYLKNLAITYHKLLKKENALEDFKRFLSESKPVEGKALYPSTKVKGWLKPWELFKNTQTASFYRYKKDARLNIYELKVSPTSDIDNRAGLVFLKVMGYEDREFGKEVEWEARKDLMEEWLKLTENKDIKSHLEEVKKVYNFFEYALPDSYYRPPVSRIAYYLFPIELRSFGGSVIVSKASLYKRRDETRKELWKEILDEFKKTKENESKKEDLEYALKKEGKNLEYLKELLEKSLSQYMLDMLRKDWKEFLKRCSKGESSKLLAVFVGKKPEANPPWVSYGTYRIPSVDLNLHVFVEKGFKVEVNGKQYNKDSNEDSIVKALAESFESFSESKYLGDAKILIDKDSKPLPLEVLFGGKDLFKLIRRYGVENNKNESKNELENKNKFKNYLGNKDSIELIYSLKYFSARLFNLMNNIKNVKAKGRFTGILMLLDTEFEEGDRYTFWDMVSFIYDYLGIPVQTLTKRSLRAILGNNGKNSIIKNLAISLYKDSKVLEVEFDGFYLPGGKTIVYAVVEKPSSRFFYRRGDMDSTGERHYLYEVYKISIEDKKAMIELEQKYFELHGMKGMGIERFIEEKKRLPNVKFCFITALKDSKLKDLYEKLSTPDEEHKKDKEHKKFLLIRYDELKSAYFSEKSERECYIIYTQEFEKLFYRLGIPVEKDVAAIAIKPAQPPSMTEDVYHPSLQLFFTERVGWENDNVYSERKNLFIFTVLALSMYESESFATPFSKLNLWAKEKNYYLKIKRNHKEYTFPLKSVLYELLFFAQERPGLGEEFKA